MRNNHRPEYKTERKVLNGYTSFPPDKVFRDYVKMKRKQALKARRINRRKGK